LFLPKIVCPEQARIFSAIDSIRLYSCDLFKAIQTVWQQISYFLLLWKKCLQSSILIELLLYFAEVYPIVVKGIVIFIAITEFFEPF